MNVLTCIIIGRGYMGLTELKITANDPGDLKHYYVQIAEELQN